MTIRPENLISQLLDTVGDGSGVYDMIGDYSATPQTFRYYSRTPGSYLSEFRLRVQDDGNITPQLYGAMPALTNGIKAVIADKAGSIAADLTAGIVIKNNGDWSLLSGKVDFKTFPGGATEEMLLADWSARGDGVYIPAGYSFELRLNDDFTGLITQRFMIFGRRSV